MKSRAPVRWAAGAFVLASLILPARSQSTLQALQQELKQAEQQHNDVTTQNLGNFFSQVDAAMASPDAAVALYQQAGGTLPDPTPVSTEHESETVTEKDARLAQDRANAAALGTLLQLHCGMLHYAALFVSKADQKGLPDEWMGWLQRAAPAYPQVTPPAAAAPKPDDTNHHHRRDAVIGKGFGSTDIKNKTMKDSIIGKYLGFNVWGDKEQGGWAVKDLPRLFKTNVLDPLRAKPNATTLAAWDSYIAMMNADEPDNAKWTQVTYPGLFFERSCDDYAAAPDMEKLEAMVKFITANNTNPQFAAWDERVNGLLKDYGAKHGEPIVDASAPAAPSLTTAPAPTGNPNETVTTEQQGDATIITKHHVTGTP